MPSTMTPVAPRARILTGDTPSGKLHIGHWVGSLENRVRLQDAYECYFLIANLHAFTTRADQPSEIARDTLDILKDWLAAGIDPERATVVVQSEVPAITELTWHLSMLLPFNRVMRNPTLAPRGPANFHVAFFFLYTMWVHVMPKGSPAEAWTAPHAPSARPV